MKKLLYDVIDVGDIISVRLEDDSYFRGEFISYDTEEEMVLVGPLTKTDFKEIKEQTSLSKDQFLTLKVFIRKKDIKTVAIIWQNHK